MDRKLVCGLEVHQQLDTRKLFCRCESVMHDDDPDFVFSRKIRPVPSELGTFDPTALDAFKRNYTFEYEAFKDSNCLIELDEEPVKEMEPIALNTALTIALLTKSNIADEIQVMRKAIADGSVTSSFQRTALVATGGSIEVNGKKIGVQSIAVEEDSARPMKRDEENKVITFRLDRLGIPLIELATHPDIETPEEAQAVALAIGTLFRRTCKAKRGLGSIRQDVNISIPNGARVEIKGCQELDMIGEYVRREMQRQQSLLDVRETLQKRGITEKSLESQTYFVLSHHFLGTTSKLFQNKHVFGIKLPGFNGLIGKEMQPGRRLGTEFASYVKSKTSLKGIIHSDELPAFGITEEEKQKIFKATQCGSEDAFVLVIGREIEPLPIPQEILKLPKTPKGYQTMQSESEKALFIVNDRAKQCLRGVPEETRNALDEGNSEYSRPLPGASRMYPETDLKTITVEETNLNSLRKNLPKTPEERVQYYTQKLKLSNQLAEKMKLDNWAIDFERWSEQGINPTLAATTLLESLTQLKRNDFPTEQLREEMIFEALKAVQEKKLVKEGLIELLGIWSKNPSLPLSALIELTGEKVSNTELDALMEKIVSENEQFVKDKGLNAIGPLMGIAMKELRGKVGGKEISEALQKAIQKKATKS